MTDIRKTFERAVNVAVTVTNLQRIDQLRREAAVTDRPKCGNCIHWMKTRDCPREGGLGSQRGGPSAGAPACPSFTLAPWVAELKAKRLAECQSALDAITL